MGPKLVASAAVLTLVAWGALSGPAMADASQCPASRVCLFSDSNYVGLLGYRQAGLALTNISSSANDKLTSWINKTSTNARWYVDANGGGGAIPGVGSGGGGPSGGGGCVNGVGCIGTGG